MYAVGAAPSAEQDIERILRDLHSRERIGKVPPNFARRFLDEIHGAIDGVWVMRVRHQRQRQLGSSGPGSAYRPELLPR